MSQTFYYSRSTTPTGSPDLAGLSLWGNIDGGFTLSRLAEVNAAKENLALVVRCSKRRDIPLDCEYRGGLSAAWFALRMPAPGTVR